MTELFENFEVNRHPRWQLLMKLLGGSIVVHLVFVTFVLYVPAFRSAFNLAALVGGTRFVDRDYTRTEIGDEVQLVELTKEKFRYPDGYWVPEGQMPEAPPAPQLVASIPPSQPITEVASPSPAVSPELSPSPGAAASSSPGAVAQASTTPPARYEGDKLTPDEAQDRLDKTAQDNNITLPKENEINKKALKDFATYANDLKKSGKLDLNKPFEIVIEAELDEEGKLKDPKFTKKAGDPNLVDLFGRMVSALNDSGFLKYLKPLDHDNPSSKVVFTIKQGENEVLASVESETSSEQSARLFALVFQKLLVDGADSRAGKDEELLLKNTTAESVGKKIKFNFSMPRQAVVDLIKKQLAS